MHPFFKKGDLLHEVLPNFRDHVVSDLNLCDEFLLERSQNVYLALLLAIRDQRSQVLAQVEAKGRHQGRDVAPFTDVEVKFLIGQRVRDLLGLEVLEQLLGPP